MLSLFFLPASTREKNRKKRKRIVDPAPFLILGDEKGRGRDLQDLLYLSVTRKRSSFPCWGEGVGGFGLISPRYTRRGEKKERKRLSSPFLLAS